MYGVTMLPARLAVEKQVRVMSECVDECKYERIVMNSDQGITCSSPFLFQAAAKISKALSLHSRVATRFEETLHIDKGVIEVNDVRGGAGVSCRSA